MDYQVTTLRTLAEVSEFLPEWRAFTETCRPAPVVYQDPEVVHLHLRQNEATTQPRIVVLRENGRLAAVAAGYLERTRYRMRLSVLTLFSLPVRRLKLFGDTVLISPQADARTALPAILEAIRALRGEMDVLYLETLRMEGPLWQALQAESEGPLRLMVSSPEPQVVREIAFGASFEEYLVSRAKKTRKNLNWQLKKWDREGPGPVELVRVDRPEQVPDFVRDLDTLFNRTWQARSFGARKRDDAKSTEFFRELAERGFLRSYVLRCGERPIAFVVGFQYRGVFHYDETGYDQDFAALGPGTVLNYHMLEDLFAHSAPRLLDFGHGENLYKKALGTDAHTVCSAYLVPRNRWRPVLAAQQLLNRGYRAGHASLTRLGWAAAVRRALKRKTPVAAGET